MQKVSGARELVFHGRWRRYLFSAVVTAICLAPPVIIMFVSLNLQAVTIRSRGCNYT